jgi:hypothetical protein
MSQAQKEAVMKALETFIIRATQKNADREEVLVLPEVVRTMIELNQLTPRR